MVGIYVILFGASTALLGQSLRMNLGTLDFHTDTTAEFQIPPQLSRYASFLFSFLGRGICMWKLYTKPWTAELTTHSLSFRRFNPLRRARYERYFRERYCSRWYCLCRPRVRPIDRTPSKHEVCSQTPIPTPLLGIFFKQQKTPWLTNFSNQQGSRWRLGRRTSLIDLSPVERHHTPYSNELLAGFTNLGHLSSRCSYLYVRIGRKEGTDTVYQDL